MSKATAPSAVSNAINIGDKLEGLATQFAGALQESQSLSQELGALVVTAHAAIVKQAAEAERAGLAMAFVDACAQMCGACGLTEGSAKVYLSNARGILRAMLAGYKPVAGATLRSMYENVPKGTGRQKATGARTPSAKVAADVAADVDADGDVIDVESRPVAKTKAEIRREAIVALFGHFDVQLEAMVAYVAENESKAMRWVESQVKAERAEVSKAVAQPIRIAA